METTLNKSKTRWFIDHDHSEISFKVKHFMVTEVKGSFKTFDATIYTTLNDFETAEIELWIDPCSIDTGDEKRDAHLKSVDFFDARNNRQITFTSSKIGDSDPEGNHELSGNLTMRGVTKDVKLIVQFGGDIKDPWGNKKPGFSVNGKIKRGDWGLVWNAPKETGGFMISDEVTILCELKLINKSQIDLKKELETMADKKNFPFTPSFN